MTVFRINFVYDDLYDVLHNGKRVALLLPGLPPSRENEHGEPWVIYLDPEAYPDLPARDLPHPLNNGFMAFDTFNEVADFLGIAEMEKAA